MQHMRKTRVAARNLFCRIRTRRWNVLSLTQNDSMASCPTPQTLACGIRCQKTRGQIERWWEEKGRRYSKRQILVFPCISVVWETLSLKIPRHTWVIMLELHLSSPAGDALSRILFEYCIAYLSIGNRGIPCLFRDRGQVDFVQIRK